MTENFRLICNAINKLGYQTTHEFMLNQDHGHFISVYAPCYGLSEPKWVQVMTIHLLENNKIQFKSGRNYILRNEVEDKSVIPINCESTFTFYTDIVKYISLLVQQVMVDNPAAAAAKLFIFRKFLCWDITTAPSLVIKYDEDIDKQFYLRKGAVLSLECHNIEDWLALKSHSNNIIIFKGCNGVNLLMFTKEGDYDITIGFKDLITLNNPRELTYKINIT